MKKVILDGISISNEDKICFFAGLNILETSEQALEVALNLKDICSNLENPFIFKASFDKANRSSVNSYRGPGISKAIEIFKELKKENIKIISDVHEISQISLLQEFIDVIQIPAFLCRQTDLIKEACETKKPINIKKGQFLSPNQMINIVEKCSVFENENILLCERGTSFGYDNLVVDMLGLSEMKKIGNPIVFDVTHSLQIPGGQGDAASGRGEQALDLALSGVAQGIAALFIETHPSPKDAKCDGPSATKLSEMASLLKKVSDLDSFIKAQK